MNTTRRMTPVVMIAASLAALFVVQASDAAEPAPVVTMPTVHVVAKRSAVLPQLVRLPEVTVVGKRERSESTRLAQLHSGTPL